MLTCKEFLHELNEYLDDTVDAELRKNLEHHVTECPNCWVIFDTTKKTLKVYKGMDPQTIPADVESRLLAALARRCAARKQKPE